MKPGLINILLLVNVGGSAGFGFGGSDNGKIILGTFKCLQKRIFIFI